ncbi:MAG: recombinase RecT [Aeromonas sp.]
MNQSATVVAELPPVEGSSGHFFSMISPQLKSQGIEALLPAGVSFETFARAAATAMSQSDQLAKANSKSVIQALIRCASHGLLPDGREAAITTFNDSKNNTINAQYIPMVDGVLKRARQSGQVAVIAAKAVFEGDGFDYWMDEHGEHINYRPNLAQRGEFKLAFAFAKLNSGELIVEVMIKDDVERVRAASRTGNSSSGPWAKWYDRMAIKSALHRLARRLPSASELVSLLESGDEFDFSRHPGERDAQPKPANLALAAMRGQPATEGAIIELQAEIEPANAADHASAYADHSAALEEAGDMASLKTAFAEAWNWAQQTKNADIRDGIKQIYDECKLRLVQQ